jgi:DNA-binding response OmpR family regulator
MRILIIEDDPFLRRAYEVGLRGQGFEVHLAADGEIGIRMAAENPPDAILMDILLPGLSGTQVLDQLKQNPDVSAIPVIVLSNSCTSSEAGAVLAMGASAYFSKSRAQLSEIGRKIRELCSAAS